MLPFAQSCLPMTQRPQLRTSALIHLQLEFYSIILKLSICFTNFTVYCSYISIFMSPVSLYHSALRDLISTLSLIAILEGVDKRLIPYCSAWSELINTLYLTASLEGLGRLIFSLSYIFVLMGLCQTYYPFSCSSLRALISSLSF